MHYEIMQHDICSPCDSCGADSYGVECITGRPVCVDAEACHNRTLGNSPTQDEAPPLGVCLRCGKNSTRRVYEGCYVCSACIDPTTTQPAGMDAERIDAFAQWLQDQKVVTAEECVAHSHAPLQDNGEPLDEAEIVGLLEGAGYVSLSPESLLAALDAPIRFAPAALVRTDVDGRRHLRPLVEPCSLASLAEYASIYGSTTPPDRPGMWICLKYGTGTVFVLDASSLALLVALEDDCGKWLYAPLPAVKLGDDVDSRG